MSDYCLLCGSSELSISVVFTAEELFSLWRHTGEETDGESFDLIQSMGKVSLYRCESCGFRFFDPDLAGDGNFYAGLKSSRYYVEYRPEFDFALSVASRHGIQHVYDVGCGSGAFIKHAAKNGLAAGGCELNHQAVQDAQQSGKLIVEGAPDQLNIPESLRGDKIMITLFHVLEHLVSPYESLLKIKQQLRLGDVIVLAVPNDLGVARVHHYDPMNWPPHHISRWRLQDLKALAKRAELSVVSEYADPMYGRAMTEFWKRNNQLAASIDRKSFYHSDLLARVCGTLYRYLGCRHYLPRRGLAISVALEI